MTPEGSDIPLVPPGEMPTRTPVAPPVPPSFAAPTPESVAADAPTSTTIPRPPGLTEAAAAVQSSITPPSAPPAAPPSAPSFGSTSYGAASPATFGGGITATPPPVAPAKGGGAGKVVLAILVAILLLGAGFALGSELGSDDETAGGRTTDRVDQPAGADASPEDRPTDAPLEGDDPEPAAAVAAAVAPTVVQVETAEGLGSGIVYDEDGLVLTNAHVVGAASDVQVVLADGSRFEGEVLGADRARDVAVVRFDPGDADLAVAVLATEDEVRVGQMAIAVGSPFGFDQTVTAGIVSAVGRPLPGPNGDLIVGMIQTDAPINSGNSGGALADRQGRIIGMNASITSRSGDNTGIGFAIPISLAVRVGDSIVDGKVPGPSFLGVRGPEAGAGNGLEEGQAGAFIGEVTAGASADGVLEVGDVIVEISGHPVRDFEALAGFIGSYLPGDDVDLTILRGERRIEVTVTLGERTNELVG